MTTLRLGVCALLTSALLSSCFTGIESTPRISAGDVRKREASERTPEQMYLSDVKPDSPSKWQRGKRFFATDDKISIIFQPGENSDSLSGHYIDFVTFESVLTFTGDSATVIVFSRDNTDDILRYRVATPVSEIMQRDRLEVPFAVEQSMVDRVSEAMSGHTFYISTPKWFSAGDNSDVTGRRHIPVTITRVEPGTYIYPLRVYFNSSDRAGEYWIPMTIGDDRSATRNFFTVFNFDNPRKRYPNITDETWDMIINSRVAPGMTRDECRLALGAPNSYRTIPVYNAQVEQWSYDNGLYLIFEDGILTRYRI